MYWWLHFCSKWHFKHHVSEVQYGGGEQTSHNIAMYIPLRFPPHRDLELPL